MRTGTGSWSVSFDVPKEAHVALYVRDALRFATDGYPPPLQGGIPDLRSLISGEERGRLEHAFPSWWPHVFDVTDQIASHRSDSDGGLSRHQALEAASARFYEPLDRHHELRQRALAWFDEHRTAHEQPPPERARRDWEISRDSAQAAAEQLQVDPGRLHVNTWLLAVQDVWWTTPRPGWLLYSPTVQDDTELLSKLMRETFLSSINE